MNSGAPLDSVTESHPRRFSTSVEKAAAQEPEDIQVQNEKEKPTEIQERKGQQQRKKSLAELDDELRAKLEERSGDGGSAGLELEDGNPVSMKRGVKNNMFRYI
ncbi:MAG: hypothetical protein M1824_006559 [Vezdaea acicularis]|nr:MAG: hypothetical protein M1824_006559 [Vezdaea acicularis]